MSFDLTNSPTTFMNMMNNVLCKVLDKFGILFFDDMPVYSKNEAEHEDRILKIL